MKYRDLFKKDTRIIEDKKLDIINKFSRNSISSLENKDKPLRKIEANSNINNILNRYTRIFKKNIFTIKPKIFINSEKNIRGKSSVKDISILNIEKPIENLKEKIYTKGKSKTYDKQ